jgi:hypothetical protein
MHAILFQMALLPLTMCRFSISTLADSVANRIIPFNRTLRMHIHLGYTMVLVLTAATFFFSASLVYFAAKASNHFVKSSQWKS